MDIQPTAVCLGIIIMAVGVGGSIIRRRWGILFVRGIRSVLRISGMRQCLDAGSCVGRRDEKAHKISLNGLCDEK
jgi:nucleoside recognition membrane protein YjiH